MAGWHWTSATMGLTERTGGSDLGMKSHQGRASSDDGSYRITGTRYSPVVANMITARISSTSCWPEYLVSAGE